MRNLSLVQLILPIAGLAISTATLAVSQSNPITTWQGGIPFIISEVGSDLQASQSLSLKPNCAQIGEVLYNDAHYYHCSSKLISGGFNGKVHQYLSKAPDCARNSIVVTTSGTYVDFTSQPDGIGAVIVEGKLKTNIYTYGVQVPIDTGLASPITNLGTPSELDGLLFCWNPG
jgi:hypothetical protein